MSSGKVAHFQFDSGASDWTLVPRPECLARKTILFPKKKERLFIMFGGTDMKWCQRFGVLGSLMTTRVFEDPTQDYGL